MADRSRSRVFVTGGAPTPTSGGAPGSVTDMVEAARSGTGTKLPPGELPAVSIDSSAARDQGYVPRYDLKAGIATAWPEFSETAK